MTRPRLIPCLLLKQGLIVRSQLFKVHQVIGNPMSTVERFSHWNVDELVILDISVDDYHDLRRDDLQQRYQGESVLDVLAEIAKVCYMPLAFGGQIRTLEDMQARLSAGADKCVINSKAIEDPSFIEAASRRFGNQCIVVSIDAGRHQDGTFEVFGHGGSTPSGLDPASWAKEVESRGAGEIFLNSINRDGSALGYDLELIRAVTAATTVPVIACGGVGNYEHFPEGITEAGASAVAAANIFHFCENSYSFAKKACIEAGLSMRSIRLNGRWFPREPYYDRSSEDEKLAARMQRAKLPANQRIRKTETQRQVVRWCTKCVLPAISAAPTEFDEGGVCMACRMAELKESIANQEWTRRRELLRDVLEQYRCHDGSNYDCVIPVSGGKDSYFQTHLIKNEFGLNPLLVTYNGNNYLDSGWYNVHRMKEVFDVDHIFYSPSVSVLKKLNRLGFAIMGDMNWHAHVGITTLPVRVAAQFKIPLLIWGEHGYLDQCGQFSMDDFPEMSFRDRLEHFARGYEWNYMVGREGITSQDMIPYKYPSDDQLFELDLRGIYIGNYVHWEANDHGEMVIQKYGFQVHPEPFDRTYRRMSNLDDMHENGVHDYLKYIKFGYGRCTDHVCKDIRAGLMTRDDGIELVRRYDHVKPRDLLRWLEYVDMTEDEFDSIADTYRDPRIWRHKGDQWVKDNIWDGGGSNTQSVRPSSATKS